MSDLVRVLRLIEYIGPREAVEKQVSESIHGTVVYGPASGGKVAITVASLHEFPQMLDEREAMLLRQIEALNAELTRAREKCDAYREELDQAYGHLNPGK